MKLSRYRNVTLTQLEQHTIYQRYDLSAEVYIRTDFRFLKPVSNNVLFWSGYENIHCFQPDEFFTEIAMFDTGCFLWSCTGNSRAVYGQT